jgi:MscS family membrane protein
VLLFYVGTLLLAFSARARALVASGSGILAFLAVTWVVVRVIDFLSRLIEDRYLGPRRHIAALVPLCRRTAKIFVVILAALATMQNLGYNVTSLLAGLGIGGLAVALAAQKTVEHVFGSVTLVTDAPVRVGDFCRFGDSVGTVEDIGLRSTRVRTLDRTVISIPNGEFSSMKIENFNLRDRIRLFTRLGLRYDTTADQLRLVLVEIKKILSEHPKLDPNGGRVRFIGFAANALDIEIFAFVMTTDYDEFLAIREDIFLRIMELIASSGTGFAAGPPKAPAVPGGGPDPRQTGAAHA